MENNLQFNTLIADICNAFIESGYDSIPDIHATEDTIIVENKFHIWTLNLKSAEYFLQDVSAGSMLWFELKKVYDKHFAITPFVSLKSNQNNMRIILLTCFALPNRAMKAKLRQLGFGEKNPYVWEKITDDDAPTKITTFDEALFPDGQTFEVKYFIDTFTFEEYSKRQAGYLVSKEAAEVEG